MSSQGQSESLLSQIKRHPFIHAASRGTPQTPDVLYVFYHLLYSNRVTLHLWPWETLQAELISESSIYANVIAQLHPVQVMDEGAMGVVGVPFRAHLSRCHLSTSQCPPEHLNLLPWYPQRQGCVWFFFPALMCSRELGQWVTAQMLSKVSCLNLVSLKRAKLLCWVSRAEKPLWD